MTKDYYYDYAREDIINKINKYDKDEKAKEKFGKLFVLVDLTNKTVVWTGNNVIRAKQKAFKYNKNVNGNWHPKIFPIKNWMKADDIEEYFGYDLRIVADVFYQEVFSYGFSDIFHVNKSNIIKFYKDTEYIDDVLTQENLIQDILDTDINKYYSNDFYTITDDLYTGKFIEIKILEYNFRIPLNRHTLVALRKFMGTAIVELQKCIFGSCVTKL